jgi:hypothetical protein
MRRGRCACGNEVKARSPSPALSLAVRLGTLLCLVGLSPLLAGGRGKPAGGRSGGAAAARGDGFSSFHSSPKVPCFSFSPFSSFFFSFSKSKSKLNLQRNYLFQSWSRGVY